MTGETTFSLESGGMSLDELISNTAKEAQLETIEEDKGSLKKDESTKPEEISEEDIFNASKKTEKEETKEVNTEEKKKVPAPDKTSESSKFPVLHSILALKEQGILSEDIDEEALKKDIEENGAAQAYVNVLAKDYDAKLQNAISSLDEELQYYLELREAGIDADKAANLISSKIQIDNLDPKILTEDTEEAESTRKSLLFKYYKETSPKLSDKEIEEVVQDKIDLGKDKVEAQKAEKFLKNLHTENIKKEKENAVNAEKEAVENQKKYINTVKETVENISKLIPEAKLNTQGKQKIQDLLLKPAKQLENGQTINGVWAKRMENPIAFDTRLAYLIHNGAFDGSLNKVTSVKKSSVLEDMEKQLNASPFNVASPSLESKTNDLLQSIENKISK